KAKQHIIKVKEIKFHPKTGENDYNYRLVQAKEFLEKGFKVKATVVFRGREMAHMEFGSRWLKKMVVDLAGIGLAETGSIQEGRNVTTIFGPVKHQIQAAPKPKAPGETTGAKPAAVEVKVAPASDAAAKGTGESREVSPAGQA
ncbi:MAG: infC, partial [Fibrobacteres bacterium]|nr:infC [Fibrobacterota bacterium]